MWSMLTKPRKLVFLFLAFVTISTLCWLAVRNVVGRKELLLSGTEELKVTKSRKLISSNSSNPGLKLIFKGPENARQKAVVQEFRHAWINYYRFAWSHDDLKPVSSGWIDWMGVGLTLVDSLDTLYIMGLKKEFKVARDWIASSLNFNRDGDVSVFEITIRVLGGLLSAFHLTGDQIFLGKALLLGDTLLPCFNVAVDKPIPCKSINLKHRLPSFVDTSVAEAGSVQLELRDLSRSSGLGIYEKIADSISRHLHRLPKIDGLALKSISAKTGEFWKSSALTVGGGVDSYYEYLLKQWIQTGKTKDWLRDEYLAAVDGIQRRLLRYTHPNHLAFLGSYSTVDPNSFVGNMEHLSCFLPGTLALGVLHGLNNTNHLALAANLTRTCYEMYRLTRTGLSPDIVSMNTNQREGTDMHVMFNEQRYPLRPETVESLFYMYVATGSEEYRTMAWAIFNSIRRYARLKTGYATVEEVDSIEDEVVDGGDRPRHADQMESFFLAETLKYLYLIFADEPKRLFPLDRFVFNTEAHPLPVYSL